MPAMQATRCIRQTQSMPSQHSIYTTSEVVTADGNHDAKRVALDLLLILISGAPLNHAGRTQA
ncbi:hypothetical protein E1K68_06170 [Pseudomonas sp. B2021]|nr:hypothetical protein [Pseudomonas sp. B2021]